MKSGIKIITGSKPFTVPSDGFMISPLSADATLYLVKLANETDNPIAQGEIKANDYTTVYPVSPNATWKIDTADTFIVTFKI